MGAGNGLVEQWATGTPEHTGHRAGPAREPRRVLSIWNPRLSIA